MLLFPCDAGREAILDGFDEGLGGRDGGEPFLNQNGFAGGPSWSASRRHPRWIARDAIKVRSFSQWYSRRRSSRAWRARSLAVRSGCSAAFGGGMGCTKGAPVRACSAA
eukprot:scaffold217347_cov27-Tisochrysis_lutea.AAC.2